MAWYAYVLQFLSGMLVTNGIPHFVAGLMGSRFHALGIAHIQRNDMGRAGLFLCAGQCLRRDVPQANPAPFLGDAPRSLQAQARGAARDNGGAASKASSINHNNIPFTLWRRGYNRKQLCCSAIYLRRRAAMVAAVPPV